MGVDDEVADPVVPKGIQYVKEVLTEDLLVGHHYSLSTDDRTQCQGQLPRSFGAGGRHARPAAGAERGVRPGGRPTGPW